MIIITITVPFHPSPVTAKKYKCRHVLKAYNGAMLMSASFLTGVCLCARHQAMASRRAARVMKSRMRRRRLRRAFVRENRNLHINITVHTCNRMWAMCNLERKILCQHLRPNRRLSPSYRQSFDAIMFEVAIRYR